MKKICIAKALFLFAVLVGGCFSASAGKLSHRAKTPDEEWKFRWEGEFKLGFNADCMEIQAGLSWWPLRFVGVGFTAGAATEIGNGIKALVVIALPKDQDQYWENWESYEPTRAIFQPSLILRSPSLLPVDKWDLDFQIYAEAGPTLATFASGSVHPHWCYMRTAVGGVFTLNRFALKLGYGLSTFDLYDGLRFGPQGEPLKSPTHYTDCFNISFAWKF